MIDEKAKLRAEAILNYPILKEIKSSNIKSIGYNLSNRMAVVTFKNGNEYAYFGVDEGDYESFALSESKGKALSGFSKRYAYIKIK